MGGGIFVKFFAKQQYNCKTRLLCPLYLINHEKFAEFSLQFYAIFIPVVPSLSYFFAQKEEVVAMEKFTSSFLKAHKKSH